MSELYQRTDCFNIEASEHHMMLCEAVFRPVGRPKMRWNTKTEWWISLLAY